MKNWVYLVLLGLGVIILSLWAANKKLTSENELLTANATALMDRADYYETEAGKSAASVQKSHSRLLRASRPLQPCVPDG